MPRLQEGDDEHARPQSPDLDVVFVWARAYLRARRRDKGDVSQRRSGTRWLPLASSVTTGHGDRGLRLETLFCSSYDPLTDRHSSQLTHIHTHTYTHSHTHRQPLRLVSLASALQSKHALIWISVKISTLSFIINTQCCCRHVTAPSSTNTSESHSEDAFRGVRINVFYMSSCDTV